MQDSFVSTGHSWKKCFTDFGWIRVISKGVNHLLVRHGTFKTVYSVCIKILNITLVQSGQLFKGMKSIIKQITSIRQKNNNPAILLLVKSFAEFFFFF